MRNISAKADGVGDTLPASDFNANLRSELQNVVTSSDQTLDAEGGPDTDVEMLGKAITIYSNAAQYYQDSGAANAYVLARTGNLKPLVDYIDGTIVTFKAGNTNTGASTVNIDSLGAKALRDSTDTALVGGEIIADRYITIRYNSTNDRFEIVNSKQAGTITVITASGNYTKPAGLLFADVILVGGGGAGGGISGAGAGTYAGAGGGGGGGYSMKRYLDSDLSSSEAVVIGAGGVGVSAAAGGSGGTSTFKSLSVTGGSGANAITTVAALSLSIGGDAGVGSGGDVDGYGVSGGFGIALAAANKISGAGGSSVAGGGRNSRTATGDGLQGLSYGAGGSGAAASNVATDYLGGDGVDGIMIVKEYY